MKYTMPTSWAKSSFESEPVRFGSSGGTVLIGPPNGIPSQRPIPSGTSSKLGRCACAIEIQLSDTSIMCYYYLFWFTWKSL